MSDAMLCDDLARLRDISDLWVPKLVDERLVEAVRIAQYTAGNVGPRGYGSGLPGELVALLGVPEGDGESPWWQMPGPEEEPRKRRSISTEKVTLMEEAIRWPALYLAGHDGPRRVLALYLRCKVFRKPFNAACKRKGWARSTCYLARDRALGYIAQGLNRDGVAVR